MTLRTLHGAPDLQDAPLSERIAAWLVTQHPQRPAHHSRPRIGILSSSRYLRDGGWPIYSGDGPTVHAILHISTAWLSQRSNWSLVGERTRLSRGLISTTVGLVLVWTLPNWSALVGLACLIPLLVLDCWSAARCPLPSAGSALDGWVDRYWTTNRWQPQLQERGLRRNWLSLTQRTLDAKQYLHLTLLASGIVVILGAVWGAVPTPFAGGLVASHALGKLGWLLMGQIAVLAIAASCLRAARSVLGFPNRLLPASWRPRALSFAVLMPFLMGGSLIALGLHVLRAPCWLALSLTCSHVSGRTRARCCCAPPSAEYSWTFGASSIRLAY